VESYRGYYSDLSIVPKSDGEETVGSFRKELTSALGSTFEGYKGGNFKMDRHTPVWVSPYGVASGRAAKGVELRGNTLVIITEIVD